jgi:hypothetical protein
MFLIPDGLSRRSFPPQKKRRQEVSLAATGIDFNRILLSA